MAQRDFRIAKITLAATLAVVFSLFITAVLALNLLFPFKYNSAVNAECNKYNIEKTLVYAVIRTESKFDKDAVSAAGARGLMQLMPATARWCALELKEEYADEKLFLPEFNIKLGVFYLNYLVKKYGKKDALAAYNAGEGNVLSWKGQIKFKETRDYVKRVNFAQRVYRFKFK